jgi:hypothetical protein
MKTPLFTEVAINFTKRNRFNIDRGYLLLENIISLVPHFGEKNNVKSLR